MLRRIDVNTVKKTFGKDSDPARAADKLDAEGNQVFNAKSTARNGFVESWEAHEASPLLLNDPGLKAGGTTLDRILDSTDAASTRQAEVSGTRLVATTTPGKKALSVGDFSADLQDAARRVLELNAGQSGVTLEGIGNAAGQDAYLKKNFASDLISEVRDAGAPTTALSNPPEQNVVLTKAGDPVEVRFTLKHLPDVVDPTMLDRQPNSELAFQVKTGVPGAIVAITGAFDAQSELNRNFSDGQRTTETRLVTADANGDVQIPIAQLGGTVQRTFNGVLGAADGAGIKQQDRHGNVSSTHESGAINLRMFKPAGANQPVEPLYAMNVKLMA